MSDYIRGEFDGLSSVAILPTIAEDLPVEIREGLARRRLLALGRPCPCGAPAPRLNRAQRREIEARQRRGLPPKTYRLKVEHENDCPATDEVLEKLAARHGVLLRRWNL